MERDPDWFERAAKEENTWVRARILDKAYADHPEQPADLAERAARMAKDNLGERHATYGVALLNLGIYHCTLGGGAARAEEFFKMAHAVLGDEHLEVAEAMFRLAVYSFEKQDFPEADRFFGDALRIRRRALGEQDLAVADCLIGMAYAKVRLDQIEAAVSLTEEALLIQSQLLPADDPRVQDTVTRLKHLQQATRGGGGEPQ